MCGRSTIGWWVEEFKLNFKSSFSHIHLKNLKGISDIIWCIVYNERCKNVLMRRAKKKKKKLIEQSYKLQREEFSHQIYSSRCSSIFILSTLNAMLPRDVKVSKFEAKHSLSLKSSPSNKRRMSLQRMRGKSSATEREMREKRADEKYPFAFPVHHHEGWCSRMNFSLSFSLPRSFSC